MKKDIPTPKHALPANFTEQTLRRAIRAKKQRQRKHWIERMFSMQTFAFLKKPVGALVAIALMIMSSASAYAAINWFNADVTVMSNDSIISVDLSECLPSAMPIGVATEDRKNIKFKITGQPHISAEELRQDMLERCEFRAVLDFYDQLLPERRSGIQSSPIKAINGNQITLERMENGIREDVTLSIGDNTTAFERRQPINTSDLRVGDSVMYVYDTANLKENVNPLAENSMVVSIFRTQYDTREYVMPKMSSLPNYFEKNNIIPIQ